MNPTRSLPGFDELRRAHPEHRSLVSRLETQILQILNEDLQATLQDEMLAQQLDGEYERVKIFLIELVEWQLLSPVFLWQCPEGYGTTLEELDPKLFPESTECERCGQRHKFRQTSVEVRFLASEPILEEVRRHSSD